MTEKIYIDGFAGLNNFEMELNRINVLIGPQASGKSVVAKLVYFFNEVLLDYAKFVLTGREDELTKFVKNEFRKNFNLNLIKTPFSISYERENFKVAISQNRELSFTFSKDAAHNVFTHRYKFKKQLQNISSELNLSNLFENNIENLEDLIGIDLNYKSFFIPVSRSFTSIIRNIKLMVYNQDILAAIDSYLLRFSTTYQQHRQQFKKEDEGLLSKETDSFDVFTKSLINANVEFINDEDYLVYEDGRRVALTDASSGEQALIPVLIYLKKLHQKGKSKLKTYLFFEEPELHIFPKFQFTLMQLLMFIFNECNVRLFITTHSPYILTSLTTLIKAGDLSNGKHNLANEVAEILRKSSVIKNSNPKQLLINPKEISAYQIKDGVAENLIDSETNLIGENIIDEVSEMDYKLFDELSDLILSTK